MSESKKTRAFSDPKDYVVARLLVARTIIDPTVKKGFVPARRYRRVGQKNRPLFRGAPILTSVYLEARA